MADPFLFRAVVGAIALAIVSAPLGALVVWNRMAYFGETVAQASLLGVALALMLELNLNLSIAFVAALMAGLLLLLSRQKAVPMDSVLGLMHHGSLALGVIAASMLKGPPVDLLGFLFGDIFAISSTDLIWIIATGALVLFVVFYLWRPMLRLAVHDELAEAEGLNPIVTRGLFILLLALTISQAIKIAGILLAIAFLIVPVVAARPFARTPEAMAFLAAAVSLVSVLTGLGISYGYDIPGGPAIVLIMSVMAGVSLAASALRRQN